MFVTMNRIHVNPESAALFEQRFRERARMVDGMPGFLRNVVLRPDAGLPESHGGGTQGQPYVVMTFWRSKEDFQNWVGSPQFKEGHAKAGSLPKEVFSAPSKLETFESFLDTEG